MSKLVLGAASADKTAPGRVILLPTNNHQASADAESEEPVQRTGKGLRRDYHAHIASEIHLEQFPGGIDCVPLLLSAMEEYGWLPEAYQRDQRLPSLYERDWLLEKDERDWLLKRKKLTWCGEMYIAIFRRELDPTPFCKDGLVIFQKLAADEGNCKVIYNTPGLVSKIMASLSSNLLHQNRECHGAQQANQESFWPADYSQGITASDVPAGDYSWTGWE
ncbi:hypothetical protein E2562_022850 [Oryza meyeriana var. granulata]|uniref:Uncharacterized protein n=1 Tax=Oryza meyeriana var. granulata TaxID=110450 RepID=A0A6G1BMZ1_9ORYZ|nr:hypothetical protein E2562_022850 [Oryza meyeriana var. granulata]